MRSIPFDRLHFITLALLTLVSAGAIAQQVADEGFTPAIGKPAYPRKDGPVVAIDEAHNNFHTLGGRYQTFAKVLRLDGYRVSPSTKLLNDGALSGIDVLVIANPLHERNVGSWSLPTPSAYSPEEADALSAWVRNGGRLLLIADHMPFPGAVSELSRVFGIEFSNGFATIGQPGQEPDLFTRENGLLADHPIVREGGIGSVQTFTGSAFRGDGLTPLLLLPRGTVSLEPQVAWQFSPETPRTDVSGWYQGAIRTWGRGRIAVFGEAAMFSAQLAGPQRQPFGMNSPTAAQNARFLLSVMHWLTANEP